MQSDRDAGYVDVSPSVNVLNATCSPERRAARRLSTPKLNAFDLELIHTPSVACISPDLPESPEHRLGVTPTSRRRPLTASTSRNCLRVQRPVATAGAPDGPLSPWRFVDLPESPLRPATTSVELNKSSSPNKWSPSATLDSPPYRSRSCHERPASTSATTFGLDDPAATAESIGARQGGRSGWGPGPPPPAVLRACLHGIEMGANASFSQTGPTRPSRGASAPVQRASMARSKSATSVKRPTVRDSALCIIAASVPISPGAAERTPAITSETSRQEQQRQSRDDTEVDEAAGLRDDTAGHREGDELDLISLVRETKAHTPILRIPQVGGALGLHFEKHKSRGHGMTTIKTSAIPINSPFATYEYPAGADGSLAAGRGAPVNSAGLRPSSSHKAFPEHISTLGPVQATSSITGAMRSRSAKSLPTRAAGTRGRTAGRSWPSSATSHGADFRSEGDITSLRLGTPSQRAPIAVAHREAMREVWRNVPSLRVQCIGFIDGGAV